MFFSKSAFKFAPNRRGARRILIAAMAVGVSGLPPLGGSGQTARDLGSVDAVVAGAESAHRSTLLEVLARNPELARLRAEADAAEAAIDGAASWPDPMASLTAFALTPETRVGSQRWSLSIQQRFPWFGKLSARSRVNGATRRFGRTVHSNYAPGTFDRHL